MNKQLCIHIKNMKEKDKQCKNKAKYGDFCGIHHKVQNKIIFNNNNIIFYNEKNIIENNSEYIKYNNLNINTLKNTISKLFIKIPLDLKDKYDLWLILYSFYSYINNIKKYEINIIKIQSYIRRKLILNRTNVINITDFLTFETSYETTGNNYFYFKDNNDKKFWFNIKSFNKLIEQDNAKNPYSMMEIDLKVINKFKKILNYYITFKNIELNININKPKLTLEQQMRDKTLNVFQKINNLDNYADFQWFLNLNISSLKKLYISIEDIWNYRAQLTNETKNKITNNTRIFDKSINQINNKRKIQDIILNDFLILIDSASELSDRKLGAIYILTALSEISHEARIGLPMYSQN